MYAMHWYALLLVLRSVEDAIGDYIGLNNAHRVEGLPAVDALKSMVDASATFSSDEALARQLKRQLLRRR